MSGVYDTGMDLLNESAAMLETTATACESSEDAARLAALAERIRIYLSTSRSTTPLGMPRIVSGEGRLMDEDVIHRTAEFNSSHIRILSD
jgi:hypothetical protein